MNEPESLIDEYSLAEESAIVSDKTQFYNYAYFLPNGQVVYIGKGNGRRMTQLGKRHDDFLAFYNQMRDLGTPIIRRIVWANHNEDLVLANEVALIRKIGRLDLRDGPLLNRTHGGEGATGAIRSKEAREKVSRAQLGRVRTEEERRKISETKTGKYYPKVSESKRGEKHNLWGTHRSKETREKIGNANRGRIHSDEAKSKMSAAKLGARLSIEHRRKITAKLTGRFCSDETRRKIGEANRKAWVVKRSQNEIQQPGNPEIT